MHVITADSEMCRHIAENDNTESDGIVEKFTGNNDPVILPKYLPAPKRTGISPEPSSSYQYISVTSKSKI
jgi:hypothetical protein